MGYFPFLCMTPEDPLNSLKANYADATTNKDALDLTVKNDLSHVLTSSLVGRVLGGRLEVLRLLGTGGMSAVYLCKHRNLDQLVAVKVLHLDRSANTINLRRLQIEAKAMFQMNHPNLIRLLDYSVDDEEMPYLVMEYVDGTTLSELISSHGKLKPERFVEIFSQVCDALSFAHASGIVHRDLKPSNIMVSRRLDHGRDEVKIVDFGIAKLMQQDRSQHLTSTGDLFGSPLYMSPEQCKGMASDHRSDLYSLGCAMFECLTGAPPFKGENAMRTMCMHSDQPVPSLKLGDISTALADSFDPIFRKLLQKDPTLRYQSALELKKDLVKVFSPAGLEPVAEKPSADRRKITLIAAILVLAALGTITLTYRLKSSPTNINRAGRSADANTIKPVEMQDGHARALLQIKSLNRQEVSARLAGNFTAAAKFAGEALAISERDFETEPTDKRYLAISYGTDSFFAGSVQRAGKVDEALSIAEPLLDMTPSVSPLDQTNIYGWHGIACFNLGMFEKANNLLKRAQALVDKGSAEPVANVVWLNYQAQILSKQGKSVQALAVYTKTESLARAYQSQSAHVLLCDTLLLKSVELLNQGKMKEAQSTFEEAKKVFSNNHMSADSNEGKSISAEEKFFEHKNSK